MDYTKIRKLIRVSTMEAVNCLLEDDWVMLGIEDGEYILARLR